MRTAKSIWAELHQLERRVTGLSEAFPPRKNRSGWPSLNAMFFEIRRLASREDTLNRIAELAGVEYASDNSITDNSDLIVERGVAAMRERVAELEGERDKALAEVKKLRADVERGRDIIQEVRRSGGELTVVMASYSWARGHDDLSVDLSKEGGA